MATDMDCVLRNTTPYMAKKISDTKVKFTRYEWLLKRIEETCISQAELARYIGGDIDPPKLNRSLLGNRQLKRREALKIAEYFQISLNEVLTGQQVDLSDAETGLLDAIETILYVLFKKDVLKPSDVSELLGIRARDFRLNLLPGAGAVLDRIQHSVHSTPSSQEAPKSRKSQLPHRGGSQKEKSAEI